MKKLLLFLLLLMPTFIYADSLTMVDAKSGFEKNGILYSDGRLLYNYYSRYETESNVRDFNLLSDGKLFLKTDNKIYIDGVAALENVKSFATFESYDAEFVYLDNDNKLYFVDFDRFNVDEPEDKLDITLLNNNVKSFITYDDRLLFLTNNNELYVRGYNNYGTKINDGNEITEPYKLLEGIVKYDLDYAISSSGDLYIFNNEKARPIIADTNIDSVLFIRDYRDVLVNKKDGTTVYLYHDYETNKYEKYNLKYKAKKARYNFILTNDNKLYAFSRNYDKNDTYVINYKLIDENVDDVNVHDRRFYSDNVYYLKNNDMYVYELQDYDDDYFYLDNMSSAITHMSQYTKPIKLLKNVKTLDFLDKNCIVLTDESILRVGDAEDGTFLGTETVSSNIPIKINDLINNNKTIKVNQIYLGFKGLLDYTVDDEFDAYATAIPYNSTNKQFVWSSSNTNVATVDNEGYITAVGVGTTTITVKTSDNSVSESKTITVHPKPTGINIKEGSSLEIANERKYLLTANVLPEDVYNKKVKWELILGDEDDFRIELPDEYGNYYNGEDIFLEENQVLIKSYNPGTYKIKVSTEDGSVSTIININSIVKVNEIDYSIPYSNNDGGKFVMYLSDNSTTKLNTYVYPDNAVNKTLKWSSSDTGVATVSSSGEITAKKVGTTIITIKSYDGEVETKVELTVKDKRSGTIATPKITNIASAGKLVLIIWNQQSASVKYEVYRSTNKKKWDKISTSADYALFDTKVKYGKTYYYKVRAYDGKKWTKYSNIKSIKIVPYQVEGLDTISIGSNNINLSWNKMDVSGYEVSRSENNKKWTKVKTITKGSTITFNNKKLKSNKTYYYKVRAYAKVGSKKIYGKWSSVIQVKTLPAPPSLKLEMKDLEKVNVIVGESKGTISYVIEKSTDGKNYALLETLTKSGTIVDENLTTGSTYYYRVQSCLTNACSEYTSASIISSTKTPSISLKTSKKKVNVTITSVNGVDGYEVYRSTKKKSGYKIQGTVTDLDNLVFSNKTKKGTTYYYKVRGYILKDGKKVYTSYSKVQKIKSK